MHDESTAGFRLSPQQKQVWFAQEEVPGLCSQCAVAIDGELDVESLAQALIRVVERHEILRTIFRRPAGMKLPLQVIRESQPVALERANLRCAAELEELLEKERRLFDLGEGPLLRATLARQTGGPPLLLLTVPSLVADGSSLRCLVRELTHFSAGRAGDGEIPEQPLQYADFSEWRNELADAGGDDAGRSYWQEQDLSSVPALALPLQSRSALTGAFTPARVAVPIAANSLVRIGAAARELGADAEAVVLAAWNVLLWRLTGQEDFVVGIRYDGRSYEEIEGALGLFARDLPIRFHVEDQPFGDLVRQMAKAVAQVRKWHDTAPEAGDRVPVGFAFETGPARFSANGTSYAFQRLVSGFGMYSLQLHCTWGDDHAEAEMSYDARLFRRADVERFARYFERLLGGLLVRPSAAALAVDLMDDAERRQTLVEFNQPATDYPRTQCIHQLFEEQAARNPSRPALAFDGRRWTYAELNARANQLAHHLRKLNVGPGVSVGLCLERSGETIIGLLAILKAGGAYVPLLPDHPKTRLAHQLAETKAPVLLTQEKILAQMPPFGGSIVCIDRDQAQWHDQPVANPTHVNGPDDLVYVIYTSGSTGTPKGVAVRHRNLVNYSHFIRSRLGLNDADSGSGLHFATVSTLAADLGNTCVFPALISGGCLHVISYDTSMETGRFAGYVARNPIDVLKITPSHLNALLATAEGRGVLPARFLILGGEAVSWDLVRRVRDLGQCAVINHYGPTETTVGSLTFSVDGNEVVRNLAATVPVGRPIANTEIYILDRSRKPVPVGVPGELYIGGAGVAAGYVNQPEQTAERFVPDAYSGRPDARLYRTGDVVRMLPGGNVEFLGRADGQVKIRGFRVEPAEVEAAMRKHANVGQAVVTPCEDKSGDRRLVAYVVPQPGRTVSADELKAFLQERLPDHMTPSAIVTLQALPLTPNGKVDHKALPDPEQARTAADKNYTAPRNAVEDALAKIWAEVVGVARVGVHDNFFDLGGHSLMATQVISRASAALSVQVPLRLIFERPTVAGLAEAIAALGGQAAEDMDHVLAELESLSEDEVQRLLALERQ
jgi:amino acid adenylation domain-containing protein